MKQQLFESCYNSYRKKTLFLKLTPNQMEHHRLERNHREPVTVDGDERHYDHSRFHLTH